MGCIHSVDESGSKLLELVSVAEWSTGVGCKSPFSDEHPVSSPLMNLILDVVNSIIHDLVFVLVLEAPDGVSVPFHPDVLETRHEVIVYVWLLVPEERHMGEQALITGTSDSIVCSCVVLVQNGVISGECGLIHQADSQEGGLVSVPSSKPDSKIDGVLNVFGVVGPVGLSFNRGSTVIISILGALSSVDANQDSDVVGDSPASYQSVQVFDATGSKGFPFGTSCFVEFSNPVADGDSDGVETVGSNLCDVCFGDPLASVLVEPPVSIVVAQVLHGSKFTRAGDVLRNTLPYG